MSLVLVVGKCLICRRRWCEISIHQFIHYNEIMSHLYAPHRPQPPASAAALATSPASTLALQVGLFGVRGGRKSPHNKNNNKRTCCRRCLLCKMPKWHCQPRGVVAPRGDGWWVTAEGWGASNLNFICWLPLTCPSIEGRLIKCLGARAAAGEIGRKTAEERHPAALSDVQRSCTMRGRERGRRPFDLYYFPSARC